MMYNIASTTERILVSSGRSTRNFAGMCGSISVHSSSVVSLACRNLSRRYLMRVVSVHDILGSPSLLTPGQNHKWLEPRNSIFGQPLKVLDEIRCSGISAAFERLRLVLCLAAGAAAGLSDAAVAAGRKARLDKLRQSASTRSD